MDALMQPQMPPPQNAVLFGEPPKTGDDDEADELTKKEQAEVVKEATERFADVQDRDKDNRDAAKEDTDFVFKRGAQWPDNVRQARERADDPVLEFNQLKQFVHQVVNDQRQGRPGIKVAPAGGKASIDVAKILRGMVRGIERDSNAEAAYDNGFLHAVVGGRGYWRVLSQYDGPKSFTQKLVIKRVSDPLGVYMDPDYQEPDGSDINYCFITEKVKKTAFQRQWPKANAISWAPIENDQQAWFPSKDEIIIADYYRRVSIKRELVLMSDGTIAWADGKDGLDAQLKADPMFLHQPDGTIVTEMKRRPCDDIKVEWHKIAGGQQVLETHKWPGKLIPVVCCMGDEIMLDGKRVYQGLIRMARDPQIMLNVGMTNQAIGLMLSPRAPWVIAEGQKKGYETQWDNANKINYSSLTYVPLSINGNVVPPPMRTAPAGIAPGWVQWNQQMVVQIRSTIGMYENSLGLHGQEVSGKAIMARERQGDNATFHFVDNMARAIALTGRIVVECIPTYYDTQRTVSMVAEDDTISQQMINVALDPKTDVRLGEYAISIDTGPTFMTRREEARESMLEFAKFVPILGQVAPDLVAKAQDWPDAEAIAERLKATLPPQIQQMLAAQEEGQDPQVAQLKATLQQITQQATQAVQQAQGMAQQAMKQAQDLQAELKAVKANKAETATLNAAKAEATLQDSDTKAQQARDTSANARDMVMLKALELMERMETRLANQQQQQDESQRAQRNEDREFVRDAQTASTVVDAHP